MASNNADNNDTVAVNDGILDLRPPKSGLVYQLLRLGLTFDHKDDSGETWCDYSRGVTATETVIADMDAKDAETITASRLATVTEIKTWRSDGAEE